MSEEKCPLLPGEGRVAVVTSEPLKATQGGILLPEVAQSAPSSGVVVAVGEGRWVDGVCRAIPYKTGDVVYFGKYNGSEVEHGGTKYRFLMSDDIICRVASGD